MQDIIGIIAVGMGLIAYVPYLRDITQHNAQPHPYSWLIWGLTSTLIFVLQLLHGAAAGSWTTATVAAMSFVVFGLALAYSGTRDITRHDKIMLGAALLAIPLWLLANEPTLSMLLLVGADIFGMAPSIRKTWNKPYSETLTMWWLNGFRHGLSIFALGSFTLITLANPVVWTVVNLGFCVMVLLRRHTKRTAASV